MFSRQVKFSFLLLSCLRSSVVLLEKTKVDFIGFSKAYRIKNPSYLDKRKRGAATFSCDIYPLYIFKLDIFHS